MRVQLMLTCLADAFYGEVGIATVRVLEHVGLEVIFPDGQTCCGQPPFNSGDWPSARAIAKRVPAVFDAKLPIIVPSGSCTAMLRDGYPMLGLETPRAFELAEYLVNEIGIDRWPLRGSLVIERRRVAFHRACHGRMIGLGDVQERLLKLVPGLELAPFEQAEQCCGFGGAFSANHPTVSAGIGLEKLKNVMESGVNTLVSGDMGCLMHLQGLIRRHQLPLKTLHYAQVLAEVLQT